MLQRRELMRCDMAVLGSWGGLTSTASLGQTAWPTKPVHLMVMFPASGASDVLTRMLAEKLQTYFKQNFVIENRTGAGGNIGMAAAMAAAPDPSTVPLRIQASTGTRLARPLDVPCGEVNGE